MIKKLLKWVAAGLALSVATLLFLYLNRSDPYAIIPGKQLIGEEVAGPIDDWSFVQQYRTVTNEVRPSDPYSVRCPEEEAKAVGHSSCSRIRT